jgi:hypothetical protein
VRRREGSGQAGGQAGGQWTEKIVGSGQERGRADRHFRNSLCTKAQIMPFFRFLDFTILYIYIYN